MQQILRVLATCRTGLGSKRRRTHLNSRSLWLFPGSRPCDRAYRLWTRRTLWQCDHSEQCESFRPMGNVSWRQSAADSTAEEHDFPDIRDLRVASCSCKAARSEPVESQCATATRRQLADYGKLRWHLPVTPIDRKRIESRGVLGARCLHH